MFQFVKKTIFAKKMKMKFNKLTILLAMLFVSMAGYAQKPQSGQLMTERVPLYCGSTGTSSADSTRLPVLFQMKIAGLAPGASYKYYARLISLSDTGSSTTTGAGIPIIIKKNGWKAISNPDLSTSGGHDTITVTLGQGDIPYWFGVMVTNDSRFTPGSYVYPMVIMEEIGTGSPVVQKMYLTDSIKVLRFSSAQDTISGTAIYGSSFTPAKSIVSLYDDENGLTNRPVSITYAESDGLTFSNMQNWYVNKVNGKSGAWGAIIPNDLSAGIKRIESRDAFFDTIIYANTESDAVWGSDSTSSRWGGAKVATSIKSDYAPLMKPEIEYVVNTTNINEQNTTVKAVVRRRYGNADSSKISVFVNAGTASSGTDYNLLTTAPIVFAPYGERTDTVRIQILDDNSSEPAENVAVRLYNSVNAKIGFQTTHSVNIIDNDIPVVTFDKPIAVTKENNGILKVKLRINSGSTTATDVKVMLKSKTDSTYVPADFKIGSSNVDTTVQFAGGNVIDSLEFNINLQDDPNSEDRPDTVVLVLRNPTSPAIVGKDSLMTIVIQDDDAASIFRFNKSTITVQENVGSVKLRIDRTLGNIYQSDVTLTYNGSSKYAQPGSDFTFTPQLVSFDLTDPDSFVLNVPIIDDNFSESVEEAVMIIRSSFNATIAKPDTFKIKIIDNDLPEYKISQITTTKAPNLVADSLNVHCVIRGLVYGVNMGPSGSPAGLTFTVMDNTGGIQVFSANNTKGYTVTEGDSVQVYGRIAQVNGMIQMTQLDTIIKFSSGNTLRAATVVSLLNESTESKLIRYNLVKLSNPAQWPSAAMSPNTTKTVMVRTANDSFPVLIDSETDIDGKPAPSGFFNLTGIGGQNDASTPYTSGYYLAPRRMSDFANLVVPIFNFTTDSSESKENRDSTTAFTLQCANITSALQINCTIKGGTATRNGDYQSNSFRLFILDPSQPSVNIKSKINDDGLPEVNETIIWVIRDNPWGTLIGSDSVHVITLIDDETNSIDQVGLGKSVKLYPNPANGLFNLQTSDLVIMKVEIVDLNGRVVKVVDDINDLNASIEIDGLSKGIYHVNITTDKGIARKILSVL